MTTHNPENSPSGISISMVDISNYGGPKIQSIVGKIDSIRGRIDDTLNQVEEGNHFRDMDVEIEDWDGNLLQEAIEGDGDYLKFVVVKMQDNKYKLKIFSQAEKHSNHAHGLLMGAGFIGFPNKNQELEIQFVPRNLSEHADLKKGSRPTFVVFDSDSCRNSIGYDKPSDPIEAELLMKAILQKAQELYTKNSPNS